MFLKRFMQGFFHLLYHQFAFTYDLVAAAVSLGSWRDWVMQVLPFIEGTQVLELGHGPGHLQRVLLSRGLFAVGLDESRQMSRQAKQRLGTTSKLTRGLAQALPFSAGSFETIAATFPSEYIFDGQTLSEILRCLSDSGRLVVLPAAWPKTQLLKLLYRVTGETPADLDEAIQSRIQKPFEQAGFRTETRIIEVKSGTLLIVLARK